MPPADDIAGGNLVHPSTPSGLLPPHEIAGWNAGNSGTVLDGIRRVAAGDEILARSHNLDPSMCALLAAHDGEPVSQWRERIRIAERILNAVMADRSPTPQITAAIDAQIDRLRDIEVAVLTVRLMASTGLRPDRALAMLTALPTVTLRLRKGETFWVRISPAVEPLVIRTMASPVPDVIFGDGASVQLPQLPETLRMALPGMALSDVVSHPVVDPMNIRITGTSEDREVNGPVDVPPRMLTILHIAPRPTVTIGRLRHSGSRTA